MGTVILSFERSGRKGNNGSSRLKPPSFVLWRGQTCGYNDVTGDQPPLDGWPPLYLYQHTNHPSRRGVIYCPTPSLQPESALTRTRTPNRNLHMGVVGLWGPPPLAPVLVVRPLAPSTPRRFAPGRLRHFFGRDFSFYPFTHSVLAWCDDTGPSHALCGEAPFEPPEPTRGCWAFEAPIPARNFQDPIVSVVRHREPSPQHNL